MQIVILYCSASPYKIDRTELAKEILKSVEKGEIVVPQDNIVSGQHKENRINGEVMGGQYALNYMHDFRRTRDMSDIFFNGNCPYTLSSQGLKWKCSQVFDPSKGGSILAGGGFILVPIVGPSFNIAQLNKNQTLAYEFSGGVKRKKKSPSVFPPTLDRNFNLDPRLGTLIPVIVSVTEEKNGTHLPRTNIGTCDLITDKGAVSAIDIFGPFNANEPIPNEQCGISWKLGPISDTLLSDDDEIDIFTVRCEHDRTNNVIRHAYRKNGQLLMTRTTVANWTIPLSDGQPFNVIWHNTSDATNPVKDISSWQFLIAYGPEWDKDGSFLGSDSNWGLMLANTNLTMLAHPQNQWVLTNDVNVAKNAVENIDITVNIKYIKYQVYNTPQSLSDCSSLGFGEVAHPLCLPIQ